MRHITEKWRVLVGIDKLDGLPRQREHALRIGRRSLLVAFGAFGEFAFAEGIERYVEALLARQCPALAGEVPLAEMAGLVARRLQRVGQRDVLLREPVAIRDRDEPLRRFRSALTSASKATTSPAPTAAPLMAETMGLLHLSML
jgi:hypothetical protein